MPPHPTRAGTSPVPVARTDTHRGVVLDVPTVPYHEKEAVMAETWSGEFYCVKCKEKREAEGRVVETNGRRMAKGVCPVCGTNLNRILGKA